MKYGYENNNKCDMIIGNKTNLEMKNMSIQPVKNNLIMILDILRNHSDAEHRLTQKEIQAFLKSDYDMLCDRKTIKRNLMNLIEYGFDIEYSEIQRGGADGNVIVTDIYYNHCFEQSEVQLISDSLLFSKFITGRETKRLIAKIESQASPYAVNVLKNSVNFESLGHTENPQIFYTVEMVNEAIEKRKQVQFSYCDYGTDKKLYPRHKEKYVINPYYTVTANGRYYLICNCEKHSDISNFRMDKIRDIELLDTPAKPIRKTQGNEHGFDLSKYMKEHIYMFNGDSVHAKLEVTSSEIGQVIDWFGKNFKVVDEYDNKCVISLTVNENALFYWTMQYGQFVKVLSPQSVAKWVKSAAMDIVKKYEE